MRQNKKSLYCVKTLIELIIPRVELYNLLNAVEPTPHLQTFSVNKIVPVMPALRFSLLICTLCEAAVVLIISST